jgi:nucleotide-binding universal stress UspA family protein
VARCGLSSLFNAVAATIIDWHGGRVEAATEDDSMNSLKSIAVGVDFSDCSRVALTQAARLAKWNDATLHVLHVIESLVATELAEALPDPAEATRKRLVTDAEERIEQWLEQLDAVPAKHTSRAVIGSPIDEMRKQVETTAADLLVLGTYGGSGKGQGTGILATKCVRKIGDKVLLVSDSQTGPFRDVVACVDFSEHSRMAVEQAIRVAAQDGSKLHLLHVYSAPWHHLHYRAPTPEASPDFKRQYLDGLRRRFDAFLEQFAGDLKALDVEASCEVIEGEHYARGIISYLNASKSDLVVLGTRGRTNLRYLLLGSTAERVVREIPCCVLAVKPTGA